MTYNLIRNAIKTPDGTVIRSYHRHDYVTYDDVNGKRYMVDGGYDYSRRSCHGDEVDLCLYDDQPHDVQRAVIVWGTYGKDGKQPLRWVPVAQMESDHIMAVLQNCLPAMAIKACMEKELEVRDEIK